MKQDLRTAEAKWNQPHLHTEGFSTDPPVVDQHPSGRTRPPDAADAADAAWFGSTKKGEPPGLAAAAAPDAASTDGKRRSTISFFVSVLGPSNQTDRSREEVHMEPEFTTSGFRGTSSSSLVHAGRPVPCEVDRECRSRDGMIWACMI